MKIRIIRLALIASLGMSSSLALAEDAYSGAWYALPGISYMNTDSKLDADDGMGVSLRLGKQISEHWDIQAGGSFARADENLNQAASGRFKQTLIGVDALYMFSREKLRPFLLVGLGAARNDVDYRQNGNSVGSGQTSWMANVGAGVQYLFNERFGLQADVRHVLSEADTVAGRDRSVGNTYLNFGAIFNFGLAEKASAPQIEASNPNKPSEVICNPTFETITVSAEKLFGFDKYNLQDAGKLQLDAAAEKLNSNQDIDLVLVTGHTDRLGSNEYNQKLSELRANEVKKYLTDKGVQASRLKAIGKGETEPVVECKDPALIGSKLIECLQPNRRVVISAEIQRENACK